MKKTSKKDILEKDVAKKIKNLEEKNRELEDSWKRALADYQNYKRRTEQEKSEIIRYSNENLMREVVAQLDNFNLLMEHSDDAGLKITVTQFLEMLKSNGLEEIDLTGKEFNADEAEAIDTVKGDKNIVIETLQKGYRYNGKVIKHSRVKVGSGK